MWASFFLKWLPLDINSLLSYQLLPLTFNILQHALITGYFYTQTSKLHDMLDYFIIYLQFASDWFCGYCHCFWRFLSNQLFFSINVTKPESVMALTCFRCLNVASASLKNKSKQTTKKCESKVIIEISITCNTSLKGK